MRIPFGQSAAIGRTFINLNTELTVAILRTVEAGWELAAKREVVHPGADEVAITETLRDAMREALALRRLPWRKTMIVAPGSESRSRPGMTAPDGRTDIPLYLTRIFARSGEHDPHVIIECKRVAAGDTDLAREYVVEGIDRFRNGKYCENHARGFMVGYVLSGSPAAVVNGINSYLTGRKRLAELLSLAGAPELAGWMSEHDRVTPNVPILLHHSMLVV
ncbi:hypothetical protein [Siccirubricoccus phaeus]|uniref:hypothetical protein n=1 Tax=Siccirubricoccus phaeus TaxID=2595053 RepID=UPI0011F0C9ED|nr:hypothetical protein [Siccirubricoccus phaeus]